ncbi:hypothetical protein PHLGIDRAFT_130184 [Phlebiopsis gigantea 11061_1 CR5-6]|uniref:Condensation domain-containing protein n=1 Tax=Phlebiopsis gigantea (strain 11061_1 CR5-6) TaxID=745531 RepID=A0A0C3NFC7_PHLG1|nr:hypothetical protein PHLGIDRAFT_130184 [Phlebiopsis gigantea 11061_1 CR5-6]
MTTCDPKLRMVRNAGVMERYHVLLSQLGFDSCVVVTGEYRSRDAATLDKAKLYTALRQVVLRHGALGMQVRTGKHSSDVPQFVRLPSVDLDTAVELRDYEGFGVDELLRSELVRQFPFDVSSPLWHLTVLGARTVVFAYHHVIGDGQSGPAFLNALLSALNTPSGPLHDGDPNVIHIPPDVPFVGPVEVYTSIFPSIPELSRTLYKMIVPPSWTDGPYAWTGNPIPQEPSLAMTVRTWQLSAADTTALLRLCRAHAATLTAFLYALVVGVLSRLVPGRPRTISSVVAVSLRRFTGAPPAVLCDHVCSTQAYVPLRPVGRAEGFPWAATAQYGARVRDAVGHARGVLGMLRLLLWLGMGEAYFRGMLGKKRESGITLSNLGKFPTSGGGEGSSGDLWRLENVYLGQCDVVRGAAIKVNVVGSPEGTTNITFTYGQDSIDADLAEEFIREVKGVLYTLLA